MSGVPAFRGPIHAANRIVVLAGLGLAGAMLSSCRSCAQPDVEEVSLAQVSQEIQFQSVDHLGPHAYLASIQRTELRDDVVVTDSQEVFEIRWDGWDDFEVRRSVDGKLASALRVVDAVAWWQRNGRWVNRGDPEPYRQELRMTWNGWEQALDLFRNRVALDQPEDGVVEGRAARRYEVSLAPPAAVGKARRRRRESEGGPVSLEGFVWVDEITAVRLVADVSGEVQRGGVTRRVHLKLARSAIGQDQNIERPKRRAGKKAVREPADGTLTPREP